MTGILPTLRIGFAMAMALAGFNYLFGGWWALPDASNPLARQLLAALVDSGLADVAFAIMLGAGALVLGGRAAPLGLAATLPVNLGALYWAVLELHPVWLPLGMLTVAVNGILMLAMLDSYRAMLDLRPLAAGETEDARYEALFCDLRGDLPVKRLLTGIVLLALVAGFYWMFVPMILGFWNLVALAIPATVLAANGLRTVARRP